MKGLLNELLSAKILSASDCEEALSEFSTFYGNEFKKYRSTFEDFKEKEHRLDDFWFQQVKVYNYEKLSFVVKLILTLSHGQASVELEFSVNNIVDKKNMKEETIVARRHIIDHMRAHKLKPYTIEIDKPLVKAATNASKIYNLDQAKKKMEKSFMLKIGSFLFLKI